MVKNVISFTIEEALLNQWKKYVRENSLNASLFVEGLLRQYLREKGIK